VRVFVSGFMSVFLPGLGHFINRRWIKGMILLLLWAGVWVMGFVSFKMLEASKMRLILAESGCGFVGLWIWIYGILDSLNCARHYRARIWDAYLRGIKGEEASEEGGLFGEGCLQYLRGEYDKALKSFKRLLKDKKDPDAHYYIGKILLRSGGGDAARAHFKAYMDSGKLEYREEIKRLLECPPCPKN